MSQSVIPQKLDQWANAEASWCSRIMQVNRHRPITSVFRVISRLGDGPVWYLLLALLPLFMGLEGLLLTLQLGLTALAATVVYKRLKAACRRPRPCQAHNDQIAALTAPLDEFSFPSGHTLHAVAFSVVACAHLPLLLPILVPLTLLIAASRIILGLHYPSDVIAGTTIGVGVASLSLLASPLFGTA